MNADKVREVLAVYRKDLRGWAFLKNPSHNKLPKFEFNREWLAHCHYMLDEMRGSSKGEWKKSSGGWVLSRVVLEKRCVHRWN